MGGMKKLWIGLAKEQAGKRGYAVVALDIEGPGADRGFDGCGANVWRSASRCGRRGGMPELPDIEVYLERLAPRIGGQPLRGVRLGNPFLLRTALPPLSAATGKRVMALRRLGKRIVLGLEEELFLVIHLMVAGRLHWKDKSGAKLPGRVGLAGFDFPTGTLILTEAGSKRRASLHVVLGAAGLSALDRAGSRCWARTSRAFVLRSGGRSTRSSVRSRTHTSWRGSAAPTRTRSCIVRACRRCA